MGKFLVVGGVKTSIKVIIAKKFIEKMIGLSEREENLVDECLYMPMCKEIQMQNCHIPLDVVFVDRKGVVCNTYPNVLPNSKNRGSWKGWNCYELPVGTISKYHIVNGTLLEMFDDDKNT